MQALRSQEALMEGESVSIAAKYGLSRENFILDPVADTDCFARVDIDIRAIAESLDTDLVTGLAPKRLVWGPYGGGKTHTLMRTMEELKQLAEIHPVRVECPDLTKKSRFHDLYREGIMRELGQDFIVGLIEDVMGAVGYARRDALMAQLKEKFQDEEFAKAAVRMTDPNFDPLRLWRWVSGVSLARADLNDLGQTQDLTQIEAARLAEMVCMLGRVLKELRGQTLVLVLDEMERLRSIGPETITTFVSGFTRLVDPNQKDVSVLMGSSAAVESEMVEVFSPGGPVVSRIGSEAQLEIPALHDPDVDRFIKGVIAYVRDPDADFQALVSSADGAVSETLEGDFFPFTPSAIEDLKSRLTQMMTPREITMKMTRALGRAFRAQSPIVSPDHVV
jgi:AAA domain